MTRFLFGSSSRRRILCTRNGQERYHGRAEEKERGCLLLILQRIQRRCLCRGRHQPGSLQNHEPELEPGRRLPKGGFQQQWPDQTASAHAELQRRQQEEIELQVPLESGRTTDTNLAPQLVTLTEKSPTLSSYTPAAALASSAPVDCAPSMDAARHRVARSSWRWLRLAMAGQSTRGCSCLRRQSRN